MHRADWRSAAMLLLFASMLLTAVSASDVPWTFQPAHHIQNCTTVTTGNSAHNRSRLTFTAFPPGPPPTTGWPLMLMFMVKSFPNQEDGAPVCGRKQHPGNYPLNWLPHGKPYGVWEAPLSAMSSCWSNGSFTMSNCSFDQLGGALWEQRYKQMLLAQGVAIMVVNTGRNGGWAQTRKQWTDPSAEDPPFFSELFRQIKAGGHGPIDPSRIVLNGWSTGGHFASWLIELWASKDPVMTGIGIAAGVFLSSGSHRCFGHPDDSIAPALTDCARCNNSQACFSQRDRRGLGCSSALLANGTSPCCEMCCPANVTEDYYYHNPAAYSSHPPCFLAQLRSYDVNSDLCAAKKYYETLRANGVHAELRLAEPADEHCYCIGTPDEPAADGSNYSSWCPKVDGEVFPDPGPMGLSCMGHTMGFSTMVLPLVNFVLNATGTPQTHEAHVLSS